MSDNEQDNFELFSPDDVYIPDDDIYADIDGVDNDDEIDSFDGDEFELEYSKKKEEQEQNRLKKKKLILEILIGAVVIVMIALAVYFCDSGIIGAYKKNFRQNFNNLFSSEMPVDIGVTEKDPNVQGYILEENDDGDEYYKKTAKSICTLPFEGASKGRFAAYRGGLICARTNYICYIDKTGEVKWEKDTTVVDPMLSTDGNYIALASENGTKLCLYNGEELIFECDTEEVINNIRVSANGDTVLVCDKENYKGSICVYNKDGKKVFSWLSGKNNIISADISTSSRRVAASLLNTEGKAFSIIKIFDINSKDNKTEINFDDTVIFKVEYSGDTVTGFGDNSLIAMTASGRVISDKRFDKVDITHYALDNEGNRLINIDSASIPVFQQYSKKGTLRNEMIIDEMPDFTDISGNTVLYNEGRDILLRKMGSSRMSRYTATMDILQLVLISDRDYAVIHSNSLEIVRN